MAIKLSDIRKAADKKFAPTTIDLEDGKSEVVLVNVLRIDKKKRDRLQNLSDELENGDAAEVLGAILAGATDSAADGKRLVAAAKGDVALLMAFLDAWAKGSDLGEASTSES